MADISDRLEVKVVSARSLSEVEGGECNPFAVARCGSEFGQTLVANRTTDPEWQSSTMIFVDIAENDVDHIVLNVMHKNLSAQADVDLGAAIVDLRTAILSPGIETDEWYALQRAPGMDQPATGRVRVEMTYFVSEGDDVLPSDDDDDDDDDEDRSPNMLVGTIVRGRHLEVEGRDLVDAYATVKIGAHKAHTSVVRRNNGPHWDQQFKLPVSDGSLSISLKVKNKGVLGNRLIGGCVVPMVEVAAHGEPGYTRWCRLDGPHGLVGDGNRGDVEVILAWRYDAKYARSLSRLLSGAGALVSGVGSVIGGIGSLAGAGLEMSRKTQAPREKATDRDEENAWMTADEEFAPLKLSSKEQEELEERREAGVMMADRRMDELERERDAAMRPGNYQVQVHIIECRDLKGEDLNGLSDPYVRIKVLGRVKKSRVVKKCTSCVFDDTFYFNFKDLSRSAIEEATIDVMVYDFDVFSAHDLIGMASFDAKKIHDLEAHEYYRQWVGLVDNLDTGDNGYQGFLKLSVTVLGPGDDQKAHDLDAEYQKELDAEMDEGELGGMALSGPSVDSKLTFLVVYVWEAEDLPPMHASIFSAGGIEAYVRVDAAGSRCSTSAVRVRGKGNLAPEFREELWLPVTEPTEAKRITVGLWDYSTFTKDRPVAHVYFDLGEVKRKDDKPSSSSWTASLFKGAKYTGPRPRWHNLYGAPLGIQGKRGALQNRYGNEATTYRGRVLLSMELMTRPSSREKTVSHRKNFHFKPTPGLKPATARYHLLALAVMGTEIPTFRSAGFGGTAKMKLVVAIGNHRLDFAFEPNRRGVVTWNALQSLRGVDLPVFLEEIPDVCLYLVRGPPKVVTVCYARIPAARLLKEQLRSDPKWELLKPDAARSRNHGGVALTANPGAVLLQLGLGLSEDAVDPDLNMNWQEAPLLKKAETLKPYCLRVYVYQARNLPASDENGLLDPYVKVRFCGKKEKTKSQAMTTAPLWYETLQFHEMLPSDPKFGPDVVLQIWDKDTFASNTAMALMRLPLVDCALLSTESARPPTPRWHVLTDINGEDVGAELLVAAALIEKRDLNEKFDRPMSIVPQMRVAWVEVTCVGVRQLKTHRLRTPREPYVRCDVPAPDDGGGTFKTKASRQPSGRNANFLSRHVMSVEMPENAVFAQCMDLRVYDARVGLTTGLQSPLLGATSVDLSTKMSWNGEGYVPPQMELFEDSDAKRRADEREEEERAKAAAADAEDEEEENDGGAGAGSVGISFGGGDDGDANEEDDDLNDGEDVDQHELERRGLVEAKGAAPAPTHDPGTGAFDPMALSDLPMIYEDLLYEEEQERLAQELAAQDAAGENEITFLDMVEARLANATDVNALVDGDVHYKMSELPIAFPNQWAAADYIAGREWWMDDRGGTELENYLKTKPFETYPVYRGKYHPNPSKSTRRPVGLFKGIIRVLDSDPAFEEEPFFPMKLLRATPYTVRVYVIRGVNLQPAEGVSADPYLRVKLGAEVDDRAKSHRPRTLKPDFYETFEFRTVLPGPATLKVQVKDWNRFYPIHELLGETKIDLEDRWFHRDWQSLDEKKEGTTNPLKPIEVRGLRTDTNPVAQGQVHMWLEIRPEHETRRDPAVHLEGPEKMKFEVRVICWKSKDVPFEMGDYFAEFWIGASRKQRTDVHWRCRNGKASWNWRIKIPVELPLDAPENGRLSIQLWDQDIIKWNDVVGECQVDLYRWFLKAYHEKRSVNVFKAINEAIERKKAEEMGLATESDLEDDDDDDGGDDDEGSSEGEEEGAEGDDGDGGGGDGEETKEEKPDGDEGEKEEGEEKPLLDEAKKKEDKDEKEDDDKDDGPKPVDAGDKDAAYFVKQFKDFIGLGEIDDTAQWIKMTINDRKRKRLLSRGSLAITIEILPEDEAGDRPAGHGRTEPNANPYLPPTTGRMSFSYNPLAICSALLGPKLAFQIICCLCCILILVAIGFLGMYFTSFYTLMQSLGLTGGSSSSTTTD